MFAFKNRRTDSSGSSFNHGSGSYDNGASMERLFKVIHSDGFDAPVSDHVVYGLAVVVRRGERLVRSRELYRLDGAPAPQK